MIAIHVLASLLALLGPLAVFVVVLGGLNHATWFFDNGHLGSWLAAFSYIATMVTLAVAGSLFLKKRRVPGSVLYAVAVVPYSVALGYAVVRHHINVGLLTAHEVGPEPARYFLWATEVTENALAVGASMSAFAMLIVALAALSHRLTHHSSAKLAVASFGSVLLLASVSAHEVARARAIYAFSIDDAARRASQMTHAGVAANVALVVGVIAIAITLTTFFVDRARRSNALLVMIVATCAASAAPAIMAERDGRFFRLADPTAAFADTRVPETRLRWREATPGTRTIAIRSDGTCTLGATQPSPEDLSSHETFGLVADREVTYAALQKLVDLDLELYVRFTPEDRAAAATLGELGKYLMTTTVARFGFYYPSDTSLTIVLDGATAHVMQAPSIDVTLPMAPEASAMRREVFKHIGGWGDDNLYIAPRPNDTLAVIWQIAEDVRASTTSTVAITLTNDRRTPAERAAATAARYSGNVW